MHWFGFYALCAVAYLSVHAAFVEFVDCAIHQNRNWCVAFYGCVVHRCNWSSRDREHLKIRGQWNGIEYISNFHHNFKSRQKVITSIRILGFHEERFRVDGGAIDGRVEWSLGTRHVERDYGEHQQPTTEIVLHGIHGRLDVCWIWFDNLNIHKMSQLFCIFSHSAYQRVSLSTFLTNICCCCCCLFFDWLR